LLVNVKTTINLSLSMLHTQVITLSLGTYYLQRMMMSECFP